MDISSLLSGLTAGDMANLKAVAEQLLGKEEKKQAEPNLFPMLDAEMLTRLTSIGRLMSTPDPRCDFLFALKPLLSEGRQHRVEEAARMLKLLSLLPMLTGGGLP